MCFDFIYAALLWAKTIFAYSTQGINIFLLAP